MELETVTLPSEIAFLPINEREEIRSDEEITDEDKLVYVCRFLDD